MPEPVVTLTVHTVPCPTAHQPIYNRAIRLLAGLIQERRAKEKQQAGAHTSTVPAQEAA